MKITKTWGSRGPGRTFFTEIPTKDSLRYRCEGWSANGREGESFFIDSDRPLERAEVERRFVNFRENPS